MVKLNERGEIILNADMETWIPGFFAAGDSIDKHNRQVATAGAAQAAANFVF